MKKLLWGIVGILVMLAAAVIIVPPLIDWNEYRAEIASRVKAATGRDLVIGGDIKIDLLPSPALLVNDVRLANLKGAEAPYMVTLKSLRIRVALGPLLGGSLSVQSVKLVEPVIELESLADGRNNFSLESEAPAEQPAGRPGPAPAQEPDRDDTAPSIQVENFVIERGAIVYRDRAAGQLERIENLNARLAATSLKGPLESSGSAVVRGLPLSFTVTAGALVEGRTLPFTADLKIIPGNVRGHISGSVSGLGGAGGIPRTKGKLTVEGDNLARFLSAVGAGGALPEIIGRPFTTTAQIAFAKQKLTIDKLAVGMAGMKGTGTASIALGDTADGKLVLKVGRLDLDKLLARPVGGQGKGAPDGKKSGKNAGPKGAKRSSASVDLTRAPRTGRQAAKGAFTLPENFNAALNISVGAAIWRGGLIREMALNASLSNGEVTVNQLSASLPGGSDVALFGFLTAPGGRPEFEGTLDARTSNLRGVFKWLNMALPPVPHGRLNSFSLVGKVKTNAKQLALGGIDLRLDGTRAKGAVTIALRKRPSFGANLSIDRLNLDGYLARPVKAAVKAPPGKKKAKSAKKPGAKKTGGKKTGADPLAPLAILGSFDANLKARIKSLTLGGLPIKEARFDGIAHNGKFQLRQLSAASIAGLSMTAKGALAGLSDEESPRIENLSFKLKTANLARFLKMAGVNYRMRAGKPMAFSLSGGATGNGRKLRIGKLAGKLGKLDFSGKGSVDLSGPRVKIDADLSTGVLKLEDYLPAESRAAKRRRTRTDLGGRKSRGRRSAGGKTKPAAPPWSDEAIDLSALGTLDADVKLRARSLIFDQYKLDNARLVANLKDGTLDAPNLSARLFGGKLSGRLNISSGGPSPAYRMALSLKDLDVPSALRKLAKKKLKSGKLDLTANLVSAGGSQAELVGALKGTGNLAIRRLDIDAHSVGGTVFAPVLVLMSSFNQLAGSLGGNRRKGLANLTGSFNMERGIARFTDFKLASNLGIGVAKGMVDLPKWHIDSEGEVRLAQNLLVQLLSRSAKSKQVLPFSVRGPLNDPVTKLETGKMPGRGITIPGIERLRRKRGVGAIINQVFPTKPPQAKPPPSVPPSTPPPQTTAPKEPPPLNTPPPATTPEKRPKPRDIIKNLLLKGLGG